MSKDNVTEFCKTHRIVCLDKNKRAHKITKMNTLYFEDSFDYNRMMFESFPMETETLYTVEITESELEKIADFEAQVFNHIKNQGHYRMFEMIMAQKEHEKYLKEKYPAVKKAYEQYSLILKLAESGEL